MDINIVMASAEEINLKRLLGKCENMARSLSEEDEWRLKKYIEYLDELLNNLKEKPNKPSCESMNTYIQRVAFLKGVLHVHHEETPLDKIVALQLAPKGNNNEDSKELHHFTNESVGAQLREELLTKKSGNLKRRKTFGDNDKAETEGTNDLDALLKYHHTMQEKIADEMLVLARNIKEQSLLAGNIIRNDSQVVEKSSSLADKNIDQLKVHSEKLQENNKKTWQCWTWVLLIVVVVIFINMVLLMKVMKKRTS